MFDAIMRGDETAYYLAQNELEALDAWRAAAIVLCLDCRAPMIHVRAGIFTCPYERHSQAAHDHARQIIRGALDRGRPRGRGGTARESSPLSMLPAAPIPEVQDD